MFQSTPNSKVMNYSNGGDVKQQVRGFARFQAATHHWLKRAESTWLRPLQDARLYT